MAVTVDGVAQVAQGAASVVAPELADEIALPASSTAGYITTGTPVDTGQLFFGLKVWRIVVRGYMTATNTNAYNVNGVATINMINIGSGHLIRFGGFIESPSVSQEHMAANNHHMKDGLPTIYKTTGDGWLHLFNGHQTAVYTGAEFTIYLEYTDSNNP